MADIPPPGNHWKKTSSRGNTTHGKGVGLTALLRSLEIGEGKEAPRFWEGSAYTIANKLGIKIACRRLGSKATTTIYRIT